MSEHFIGFPPFGGTRNLHAVVRAIPHKLLNAIQVQEFSFWNETTINSFRNDSFRINVTLVSCGNWYELVLEQNSFRYHVESP